MKMKTFLILSALMVIGFSAVAYSQDKGYPNKPIQLLVPHSGGIDLFFRLISEELTKTWKVQVNVINKFAGGGTLAAIDVANAEKDGHLLLGTLVSKIAGMTIANPKAAFSIQNFDPVAVYHGYSTVALITKNESQFRSLEDVVDFARKKPGELVCGTALAGTLLYLDAMLLNRFAKISLTILPFDGASEVITNVLGGHVALGFVSDVLAKPYVDAGKIRVLCTDIKSSIIAVPSFAEKGYPQINLVSSMVVLGPKGLRPTMLTTWEKALETINRDAKFLASSKKLGVNVDLRIGTATLNEYLRNETEKYSRFTPEELGWKK